MGTRSMTYVVDAYNNVVLSLYRQSDGYPEELGQGWDCYNLLCGRKLCNGFCLDTAYTNTSNGLDDLAALMVWYLKKESKIGGVYLYPAPKLKTYKGTHELNADDLAKLAEAARSTGADYAYIITESKDGKGGLRIVVLSLNYGREDVAYDGSPEGLAEKFGYITLNNILSENPDAEASGRAAI